MVWTTLSVRVFFADLSRYYEAGIGFGILYIIVAVLNMIQITLLDLFDPPHLIPEANDHPIVAAQAKSESS